MSDDTRRQFLVQSMTGLSAVWLSASWSQIAAAAETVQSGDWTQYAFFTPAQGADVEAMAARIFPTTDTPGAREAQVIGFIDLALMSFAKDQQAVVTRGLEDLHARTSTMFPGAVSFAVLSEAPQLQLLTAIETTPFFRAVRDLTVTGLFAAPQHGGNFGKLGWNLIGFDDALNFHTPFGFYDA